LQCTFSGVIVNNNSNNGGISGKLNEHFAEVKTEMSDDCLHSVYIRPICFWFCMKDHKYTWFLQFSWFWIS